MECGSWLVSLRVSGAARATSRSAFHYPHRGFHVFVLAVIETRMPYKACLWIIFGRGDEEK